MYIDVLKAADLVKLGGVVAFPTETVYGLAADFNNSLAVDEIFKIKQRPDNNPLTLMLSEADDIYNFLTVVPLHLNALMDRFWPGSLTLALPVIGNKVDVRIRAGLPTAGFRIPSNSIAQNLLKLCGPIVAPSANLSGMSPAKSVSEVEGYFGADFPAIDNDEKLLGESSTVLVYCEGRWCIGREGALPLSDIAAVLGYSPLKR